MPERRQRFGTWLRRAAVLGAVAAAGAMLFDVLTRITPPTLPPPTPQDLTYEDATVRLGDAYLARRGRLWVMQTAGDPVALGYQHARLASPLMAEGDGRMLELFATTVPSRPLRAVVSAIVRARYRNLDRGFPEARRAEIYGESVGYADPYTHVFPTYQRLVYLHALYDISLAFEHSPLLACTAFVAAGPAVGGATPGHTIVGRNFDFDVDPWFDDDKIVEIVAPAGAIPFVSVAWPGMTGAVTGMNGEGIWVSVNGGRAGELDSAGVPVVFTTRAVLEGAHSLDEAIAIIERHHPMASHILLLADGETGESAVVERAPGRALGIVRDPSTTVLANHYRTAPLNQDPKDARIRDVTTTVARDARMRELVTRQRGTIDPAAAAAMLRDRDGVGDAPLPLGSRNALDAVVSTHSVVADLTDRVLWVSEGPHTLGAYRRIDLRARLRDGERAARSEASGDLPEDPALRDGTWDRFALGVRLRRDARAALDDGRADAAVDLYRRATALRPDDHLAWRGLAEAAERAHTPELARGAWQRVLALAPEGPAAEREARASVDASEADAHHARHDQ
jgi:isopenicillin-N N-acyltransferase like protein